MPFALNQIVKVAFTFALLVSFGCQRQEPIASYTVARTSPPRPPLDTTAVLQQLDHILVAIVPQDDKAWFFKLVGAAPAIDRQREAFRAFLSTVKLADSPNETPSWEVPASWEEKAASAMRAATLLVPDASGDLELAVSSLPRTETWQDFLVPNVNRWLRQLQQKALPGAMILKLAQQAPTGDGKVTATVFELSGALLQQPMGAGTGPHGGPQGGPHRAPEGELGTDREVAGAGPTSPPTTTSPPTDNSLTYVTPDGWQPGKLSMMRKAAFQLPGGEASNEVTVMSFPAAPGSQMGDVAANVQRWAGQVGLDPPAGDQLDKLTETMTVAGIEGSYVELVSPEGSPRDVALFAAMIQRDNQVWFFKMVGSRDVVSGQQAAFREFLSSVRLP